MTRPVLSRLARRLLLVPVLSAGLTVVVLPASADQPGALPGPAQGNAFGLERVGGVPAPAFAHRPAGRGDGRKVH